MTKTTPVLKEGDRIRTVDQDDVSHGTSVIIVKERGIEDVVET